MVEVIKGLNDAEVAEFSRERVRQVEAKAIRKLQHPVRARKLEGYLDAAGVHHIA